MLDDSDNDSMWRMTSTSNIWNTTSSHSLKYRQCTCSDKTCILLKKVVRLGGWRWQETLDGPPLEVLPNTQPPIIQYHKCNVNNKVPHACTHVCTQPTYPVNWNTRIPTHIDHGNQLISAYKYRFVQVQLVYRFDLQRTGCMLTINQSVWVCCHSAMKPFVTEKYI